MSCCIKTIGIAIYFLLYDLFRRLPIQRGNQNKGYIKNQYTPQLIEEHMTLYSSVNRGICGHMARAWGGGPSIFISYV
jgi:hypothetical protein